MSNASRSEELDKILISLSNGTRDVKLSSDNDPDAQYLNKIKINQMATLLKMDYLLEKIMHPLIFVIVAVIIGLTWYITGLINKDIFVKIHTTITPILTHCCSIVFAFLLSQYLENWKKTRDR